VDSQVITNTTPKYSTVMSLWSTCVNQHRFKKC